jgi:lipopolysaccharide/colanic/teichoic acid biosynthesis glycosyltransferase
MPASGLPRQVDVVVSVMLLVVTSPLLAAAAVAIKLETPGPVLFRQLRVGRGGRPFEMLKLRTFQHGAPPEGTWVPLDERNDPRITRVGRWLRGTSLDEVPNLVNVLRGEMALVGPRPTIPAQVAEYTAEQHRRLEVRPGITGLAQVSGRRSLSWPERIAIDVWYVDHRTPLMDIRVLLRTAAQTLGLGRTRFVPDDGTGPGSGPLRAPST